MGIKNGLRKTAKGWQVVARVWVAGKIRVKKRTITGSKEEAKALREALKKELRGGIPICSLTMQIQFFKDMVEIYREKRGPFSKTHEYNVMRLEDEFGLMEPRGFPARFERFIKRYREAGKNHQANRFIEVARAVYQCCIGLGILRINPITPELFPESKEEPRDVMLPVEEQRRIVMIAARNRRTAHIARYLQYVFQVPCRKMEMVNAKILDVDLFNMAIRIPNGSTKNDVGTWKPIPPNMQNWTRRRVRMARSLEEPVFGRYVRCSGVIVRLGNFTGAWNTVRKAAGFPDLRIHDTRHISATELIDNNTPEEVVNQIAGWKSPMLRNYYHRNPKRALELVRFSREIRYEPDMNPRRAKAI